MTASDYPKKDQQQNGMGETPDCGVAFATSILLPAALIVACFVIGVDAMGWALSAVTILLIVAGIGWRPLRSGLTPSIVLLVPIWGLVARLDRIATCNALRVAKIYADPDKTRTIPATTWRKNGDVFVRFDGGGQPGMSPAHLNELLQQNARVWRCRSFAISEDSEHVGRFTLQLSPKDTVQTMLDQPIIGVVS